MKTHFIIIQIRKNILSIIFILFTICLIIFSRQNLEAAKTGLILWSSSVVPALLPFFIACELLTYTNIVEILGQKLKHIMRTNI